MTDIEATLTIFGPIGPLIWDFPIDISEGRRWIRLPLRDGVPREFFLECRREEDEMTLRFWGYLGEFSTPRLKVPRYTSMTYELRAWSDFSPGVKDAILRLRSE